MEKFTYTSEALAKERDLFRQNIALLEATEGYARLNCKQQEIIRVALYLQDRSDRDDTDPNPSFFKWVLDKFLQKEPSNNKYDLCTEHIIRWYCHGAIASLENCHLAGEEPPENPNEFFDANYFVINNEYDLKKAIEFVGFPSVVHINEEPDNYQGEISQYHSFLALGHNQDQNIIIWEKVGFGYPYRVSTLHQVYLDYRFAEYWGVRKLKDTKK